jgi:hypothetical protein
MARRPEHMDPFSESSAHFTFLGYFMRVRLPEAGSEDYRDGTDRQALFTNAEVEVPIGRCSRCAQLVEWKASTRIQHLEYCWRMSRAVARRGVSKQREVL